MTVNSWKSFFVGGQVKKCKFCGKDIERSRLVSPILDVKK